jgi:hypothetical protein
LSVPRKPKTSRLPFNKDRVHGCLRFEFTHSLRIPDHHVTVDLFERPWIRTDGIEVHAVSEAMVGHGWEEMARDTTFLVSEKEFERLLEAVGRIEVPKVRSTDDLSVGCDGYHSVVEYGDLQNSVAIKIWAPSERRGPVGYFVACKEFLKLGGFDPEKIFGR